MTMTPRERLLTALARGTPDRMPATVHQWQFYHLNKHLGGITPLDAFRRFGLDASIQFSPQDPVETPDWRISVTTSRTAEGNTLTATTYATPKGTLREVFESNDTTAWVVERMIKDPDEIDLLRRYMPVPRLRIDAVRAMKAALGDDGILRGVPFGHQGGPWQDACCLFGTERMILSTFDDPTWAHAFVSIITAKRLEFIERELAGAPFDLFETGGGSGSSTVISPAIFREYCVPADRQIHDALHALGLRVVYHTCGGMMPILEDIVSNGCDASETLSPPEVGGDARPAELKRRIGDKVCLIGGLNQHQVLTDGTPDDVRRHVHGLFESYGVGGGYICSPSDHFFETPVANLEAYASAARECVYA